jgi:hypothetical protein
MEPEHEHAAGADSPQQQPVGDQGVGEVQAHPAAAAAVAALERDTDDGHGHAAHGRADRGVRRISPTARVATQDRKPARR